MSASRGTSVVGEVDAVEPGRMLADRLGAPAPHVIADRPDGRDRRLDVKLGARQQLGQPPDAERGDWFSPKIDPVEHLASLIGCRTT